MDIDTIFRETIKFEMEGKNQAIHEYDKMLWNLRIGYLTVFFGVWALLIRTVIEKGVVPQRSQIFFLMTILAFVIAAGAFFVDTNYVRRKYKVIKAMNDLYGRITDMAVSKDSALEGFRNLLLISGTTKVKSMEKRDTDSLRGTGYVRELLVCFAIYLVPLDSSVYWFWFDAIITGSPEIVRSDQIIQRAGFACLIVQCCGFPDYGTIVSVRHHVSVKVLCCRINSSVPKSNGQYDSSSLLLPILFICSSVRFPVPTTPRMSPGSTLSPFETFR